MVRRATNLRTGSSRPGVVSTACRDPITRPLVNRAGALGDLPLIVLSVTDQPRKGAELTELQAALPGLSSDSRNVIVKGAITRDSSLARSMPAW